MANVVSGALLQIKCPDELRELKAWVTWSHEQTPEEKARGKKPRKVPYYADGTRRHGVQGTPQDRGRLVTFDQAKVAAMKAGRDGVGFVPQPEMGLVVIDFDDAILSDGTMLPEVLTAVGSTYSEVSPSGKGVHAFFKGTWPNKKSHANADRFGVEVFCSSGFVTFTGQATEDCKLVSTENTIAPLSEPMLQMLSERFLQDGPQRERPSSSGEAMGYTDEQLEQLLAAIEPGDDDYHAWLNVGMALHHETDGDSRGFELWDEWSQRGAKYEGRDILQGKWDGFGRGSQAPVTIRSLLRRAIQAGVSIGAPIATADEFEVIEDTPEEVAAKKAKADRFQRIHVGDLVQLPDPDWLIEDMLPQAELAVIYGASGSGKSFVLIDLMMAIARGVPWRGLDVKQGPVTYICAEGALGFRKRVKAYCQHHQVDPATIPFYVIQAAPNFLVKDDVAAVREACRVGEGSLVVVVDTLAKVTPGANENAGEDMGLALDNCRKVHDATGALIVLVHHTGKDEERGARGWSGLKGAADAEFKVVRDLASGTRWLENTKQKDEEDDARWGFKLERIMVGITDKGKEVTSCVILEDQAPQKGKRRPTAKLKPWPAAVMEALADLRGVTGQAVKLPDLIQAAADKRPEAGELRHRKANAKRAIEGLAKGKDALLILEAGGAVPLVLEAQE